LHWVDLSTWARGLVDDETPSFCPVLRAHVLDAQTLSEWVHNVRRQVRALVFPPVLDLMASNGLQQAAAAFDCFALGRSDACPLKLLRASLRWLVDVDATWPAIQILSLVTPHPDVHWTEATWLPDQVRDEVRQTFPWSVDEAELLLTAPAGDMWHRGDLGQSIYMLLVEDPRHVELLDRVVTTTADDDAASQATLMLVALAGEDGLGTLERLISFRPGLSGEPLVSELRATLLEHGHVSMFSLTRGQPLPGGESGSSERVCDLGRVPVWIKERTTSSVSGSCANRSRMT